MQKCTPLVIIVLTLACHGGVGGNPGDAGGDDTNNANADTDDMPPADPAPTAAISPLWIQSKAVGEWAQIPNTASPGEVHDYSGVGVRDTGGIIEIASLANGGHGGNLSENSVKSIRLDVDVPAWTVRRGPSDATGWDTTGASGAYMPSDNRPGPRHNYSMTRWVPELNRYIIFGGRFWGSQAYDYWKTDAFNPDTNDWDPPGTYVDSTGHIIATRDPATGLLYSTVGDALNAFDPSTKTFSNVASYSGNASVTRQGSAFDSTRGIIYHLSTGDNFSLGGDIHSATIDPATAHTNAIAFNDSAAWTDFKTYATTFLCSTLVYDKDLDRYYFYNGGAEGTQKVYRVTPNTTTTWDMDFMPVTGVVPALSGGGVNNKFAYISALGACVLVVGAQDVYFMRTL